MLKLAVHREGKVTALRVSGQYLEGDEITPLRDAVLSRLESGTLVIDLAKVDSIDAGVLGVLIDLCKWTRSIGSQLKRVNVTRNAGSDRWPRRWRTFVVSEFTRADEMATIGEAATNASLANLRKMLSKLDSNLFESPTMNEDQINSNRRGELGRHELRPSEPAA